MHTLFFWRLICMNRSLGCCASSLIVAAKINHHLAARLQADDANAKCHEGRAVLAAVCRCLHRNGVGEDNWGRSQKSATHSS